MAIEQYGTAQSGTKKNLTVGQLSPSQLEAELLFWQKEVAKYDKSVKEAPANSAERGSFAKQLDGAMLRLVQTQALLVQKSQDYTPMAGPQTASTKKDVASAKKYKGLNVNSLVATAESIASTSNTAVPSRSYVLSQSTAALIQPVLSQNWNAVQTVGASKQASPSTDQRGFQEAIDTATRTGRAPTAPATPAATPATPRASTGAGTRTGTGRARAETVVVDGKRVRVGSEQWKTIIQEEFGGLWDVYNENADVKAVIDKSVKEGWFNDETKLTAALQGTNWFRTTEQAARQYAIRLSSDPATLEDEIKAKVDDFRASTLESGLTLDDGTLRRLATDSIKFGWTQQQTVNAIGSEAVSLAQAGGPQGIANLRQGNVGRNLRQKAQAYAQRVSDTDIDTWVADIMKGTKTETQWEDLMRNSAKTQFRSLAPNIDRGETVEDAMYSYKQQAVSTLGSTLDVTKIDWTSDKWNKALNHRDERTGEYRQMDLWEWNKYLRTLPEWQETDDAKEAYRNVAYSLAQGFGKMA